MATSVDNRDFLLRKIQTPGTNALDYLGRACTATTDGMGRNLLAPAAPSTATAVTLGQLYMATTGVILQVTTGGTTTTGSPAPPGYGLTVTSGTAVFTQVTST